MPPQNQVFDPALMSQRPQVTVPEIQPQAIEWVLLCIAHSPMVRQDAQGVLLGHHFLPHEEPLRLAWLAIHDSLQHTHGVSFETLCYYADYRMRQERVSLLPQQAEYMFRADPEGLLYSLANPDVTLTDVNLRLGSQLLRQLAYERTVVQPLRRILNPQLQQGVPVNLQEFLTRLSPHMARITALDGVPRFEVAPEIGTEVEPASEIIPTGLSFVDTALGGQRPGDANGILGPTGGGKTTLAIHLSAELSRTYWTQWQLQGGKSPYVVFATYEEEAKKIRPRVWSALMRIPRTKLEAAENVWASLTTQDNLAEYERRLQAGSPELLSESDRYRRDAPILRECFELWDLSGSEEFPDAGSGYIDELVGYVERRAHERGRPPSALVIDYAGLVVENYMHARGLDASQYRPLLKQFSNAVRKQIAGRFGMTVWLLHQLRGEAGSFPPTRRMRHTDAGESKDFANNLAVCACLGTRQENNGCCWLNWSKVRYRPIEDVAPTLLRINEQFAIMDDASEMYVLDDSGSEFVLRADQRQLGGTDALVRRGGPAAGGVLDPTTGVIV